MHRRHSHIIAHHLIVSSYGFWLANDPRGSGSSEIRQEKFEELGPIHPGRKKEQPTRASLHAFYSEATPKLAHRPLWFDQTTRELIASSFAAIIDQKRYIACACFIGSNHAHLCVRAHRDRHDIMWKHLAEQSRKDLHTRSIVESSHPVWADRPYSIFLHSSDDIYRTIKYINENAVKEGLPVQRWPFVTEYDGWPWIASSSQER